jgi:hypothetical protein
MAFWSKKTESSETHDAFDRGAKIIRQADELCKPLLAAKSPPWPCEETQVFHQTKSCTY